jgi:hypothetical protein
MLTSAAGCAQDAASRNKPQPRSIAEIGHASAWPHIGAPPPADAPASRLGAWRAESASYSEAFESIKRSWTGFAASADDLRFKVQQYEDLIRTFTESGGYGNLILADIARRLSDALLSQWAVVRVQESGLARELMEKDRVHLLDCQAAGDMVTEESGVAAPAGGWRLSDRAGVEVAFRASHSDLNNETDRMLLGGSTQPRLMTKRDVNGLIYMLIGEEVTDRMSLPTLLEFERLGGDPANMRNWESVMRNQQHTFPFPMLGEQGGIGAGAHVGALIQRARVWEGRQVPFSAFVPQ